MPTATRQARRSQIESRISSASPPLYRSCCKVGSNVRSARRNASSTGVRRIEYQMVMKVCIVGAGAVGGLIGARLAHAGADVSAVVRAETAAALRKHGWRLQIGGQT